MVDITQTKDMLGRGGLCTVSLAQEVLAKHLAAIPIKVEEIPLSEAFDRVLAEPIYSSEDLPAHPRSTMDGYAVRAADTFGASESMPCYLNITGEVLMGQAPKGEVKKGCCHKIPTGGLCPAGADSVVMFEHTVPVDETMLEVVKGVGAGTNLVQTGEDIAAASLALPAGWRLRPQDIGLLAAIGVSNVTVTKRIRVGILSTGDEIIPHTEKPEPGQIRNINTLALCGLVRQAGGVYVDYGIVTDQKDIFLPAVKKAATENDIVLFSGGSSVGVRDLGEQVIEELGPPGILVHGVKLKPGKPVIIGLSGNTPIFGLPGHPVSAMVCFDFFIKPAIRTLSGLTATSNLPSTAVQARVTRNINSSAGRLDVIRVKLEKIDSIWNAQPIMGKSGSISTLSRAHGYFLIDEDSQGVSENSIVKVILFK
ncbi:MAG: molybdopterin molybdotransferase [Desulforhopalus sp.]|jgi:molybdopterin molybdotransferase